MQQPSPFQSAHSQPPAIKRRLLLVEDDSVSLTALRKILLRLNWEVVSATTIAEAMTLIENAPIENSPDAVVLDLMLPDGNGVKVLERIRALGLKVRVAVTTGSSDPTILNYLNTLRPDLVLRKPIDLPTLLRGLTA